MLVKNKFLLIVFIFAYSFTFSQTTIVQLDQYGTSAYAAYSGKRLVIPLHKTKGNNFYIEIPIKNFKDTLKLLVWKKNGSYFPKKIKCLNNASWSFDYNSDKHTISISEGELYSEFHLYDFSKRNGAIKSVSKIDNSTVLDSNKWYGIERAKVKFGKFETNNGTYTITVVNFDKDNQFGPSEDYISIDTSFSRIRNTVTNARCGEVSNIKYLDFEDVYYIVQKIDPNGRYIEIEKCNKISADSSVYFDSSLRVYDYVSEGSTLNIHSLLGDGKYVILSLFMEFCNPCLDDIPKLNKLQKEYSDKVVILGLFRGDQKDLTRLEENFNIKYSLGLLNSEIKKDVLANGYPYKVIISPDGKIVKLGVRRTEDLEKFLKTLD